MSREVWGLESERVALAWRFPGAASDEALMLSVISSIMSNGQAGLIDLNLMQEQKLWYRLFARFLYSMLSELLAISNTVEYASTSP